MSVHAIRGQVKARSQRIEILKIHNRHRTGQLRFSTLKLKSGELAHKAPSAIATQQPGRLKVSMHRLHRDAIRCLRKADDLMAEPNVNAKLLRSIGEQRLDGFETHHASTSR